MTRRVLAQPRLTELHPVTWRNVLLGALQGFRRDNCVDAAAALTYWSLLALFPALLVVTSLVGLVVTDRAAVDTVVQTVTDLVPTGAAGVVEARIREVTGRQTAAGVLLSFSLLGALWTASAYLRAFTRAANNVYEVAEGRPFYLLLPLQLGLTVVGLALTAVLLGGLVVSGPVAAEVGSALGVDQAAVTAWNAAKWPVLALLGMLALSLLIWVAPNVQQPRLRWLAVGSLVTLVVAGVVSVGFGFYVANFGMYDVTYGTLGAVIVFLVWLFLVNCAVLLGVEVNAELQRGRHLQADRQRDPDAPPLPPRNARGD